MTAALAPAARLARRLGLYGGSFDPPHRCHVEVAERAAAEFELEHVVFVPAARPPHKLERTLASEADRVALLELLIAPLGDRASVWTGELEREGPSFSIDTVQALARETEAKLFWILGSDNLPGLARWHRVEALLDAARPIVHVRRGDELELAWLEGLSDTARERVLAGYLEVEPCDASSSAVRAAVARGDAVDDVLPAALSEYIEAHGLYRAR
ncbi:MAG: nicotinate (nicotinamide) nucleotide adenylyltransferase [Planctomycetota bacterium]